MNEPHDIWTQWPLSELPEPRPPEAIGCWIKVGDKLPRDINDAICHCSTTGIAVCIVWTAQTYIVLEQIEPITDEDEKADLEAAGVPWETCIAQSFDIIPTVELEGWTDDDAEAWYECLRAVATEKAEQHFVRTDALRLFINSDCESGLFNSSALVHN